MLPKVSPSPSPLTLGSIQDQPIKTAYEAELYNAIINHDAASLVYLLDNQEIDLGIVFDDAGWGAGKTPIHLAVELNNNEAVQLLTTAAVNQPDVLATVDKNGYTPLMSAVSARNVDVMKILFDAGGGVAAHLQSDYPGGVSDSQKNVILDTTRLWVSSNGDRAQALEGAIVARNNVAAETFLAGRSEATLSLFTPYLEASRRDDVQWLINENLLSREDKKEILEAAAKMDNASIINSLVGQGQQGLSIAQSVISKFALEGNEKGISAILAEKKQLGASALEALARDGQLPKDVKIKAMNVIINGGSGQDSCKPLINRSLSLNQNLDLVSLLVAAGADASVPLVWMALNNKQEMLSSLIHNGGLDSALKLLDNPNEALMGAGIFAIEDQNARVSFAKLPKSDGWITVSSLISRSTIDPFKADVAANNFNTVEALIDNDVLIANLVVGLAKDNLRSSIQKIFDMGGNIEKAMDKLMADARHYETAGNHVAANIELNAYHQLGLMLAVEFRQKTSA